MRLGILSLRFAKRKLKSCVFYREQKRGERERRGGEEEGGAPGHHPRHHTRVVYKYTVYTWAKLVVELAHR